MVTSGDPKQIERAIGIIENQRAALYKAIGKEPAGGDVDLLADFPDLQQKVAESQITRDDALELAQGRREKAAREQQERAQREQHNSKAQSAEQQKKAADDALDSITKWTDGLAKSDLDYKAKEGKLLAKVEGVVKEYPPNLWLPTLKMMYEGIEVQKAPAPSGTASPRTRRARR